MDAKTLKISGRIAGGILKKKAIQSIRKLDKGYVIVALPNNLLINTERIDTGYHPIFATELEKLIKKQE